MVIEKYGYVQAIQGDDLYINTFTDEPIVMTINDKKIRNELYCKYVKVTVEELAEEEYVKCLEKEAALQVPKIKKVNEQTQGGKSLPHEWYGKVTQIDGEMTKVKDTNKESDYCGQEFDRKNDMFELRINDE